MALILFLIVLLLLQAALCLFRTGKNREPTNIETENAFYGSLGKL